VNISLPKLRIEKFDDDDEDDDNNNNNNNRHENITWNAPDGSSKVYVETVT